MMDNIIIFVIFPLLLLLNINIYFDAKINPAPFEKTQTLGLRGIAAIMVIVSHYSQLMLEKGTFNVNLIPLGSSGVIIFFFISGYGLAKSTELEVQSYTFMLKRIKLVWLPFVCYRIVALFLFHHPIKINSAIAYVFGIKEPMWFINVIMALYFLFYIVTQISKEKHIKIFILSLLIVGFSAIEFDIWGLSHKEYYANNIVFVYGIFLAIYENKIYNFIKRKFCLIFTFSLIYFMISTIGYVLFRSYAYFTLIFQLLYSIGLTLLIYIFSYKVRVKKGFYVEMGKCSLFLYILHIDIYSVFEEKWTFFNNYVIILYFTLVIGLGLAFQYILNFTQKGSKNETR